MIVHVAVAIVGYDNVHDVVRCVTALANSTYDDFEIVICENGGKTACEALRARLRPGGVDVTVITPGFFVSPMSDRFAGRKPLITSSVRAARLVRRGLGRRQGRISFPRPLAALMRVLDLFPWRLGDRLIRMFRFDIGVS